jgi:hypothetical protein
VRHSATPAPPEIETLHLQFSQFLFVTSEKTWLLDIFGVGQAAMLTLPGVLHSEYSTTLGVARA